MIFSNQNIALFSSVPVSGLFLCIYSRFGSLKLCIHLFSQEKSQLHSYRYLTDDGCIIFKSCQTFILILIRLGSILLQQKIILTRSSDFTNMFRVIHLQLKFTLRHCSGKTFTFRCYVDFNYVNTGQA